MDDSNPYRAPVVDDPGHDDLDLELERVASGQRLVIYGILLYLGGVLIQVFIGQLAGIFLLAALPLAVIGTIRLARGLRYSILATVFLALLLFVPLIGLLVLVLLNSRAITALRAGGYRVGLFGARR